MLNVPKVSESMGVSPTTIRNWANWHIDYLSPGASPGRRKPLRFNNHDMQVLQAVQQLRTEGMSTDEINARLASQTASMVDTAFDNAAPRVASPVAPEGVSSASASMLHRLDEIDTRLLKLERTVNQLRTMLVGVGVALLAVCVRLVRG